MTEEKQLERVRVCESVRVCVIEERERATEREKERLQENVQDLEKYKWRLEHYVCLRLRVSIFLCACVLESKEKEG